MQNHVVTNTYLTVSFKDKDAAKALGARWDGLQRKWYVPEGRELAPFAQWLPNNDDASHPPAPSSALAMPISGHTDLAPAAKKGIALSTLLAGVSQAVAQAYKVGVWTLAEVVELRTNAGHVYMGLSERDSSGSVLAKTNAVIWQSVANTILPEFESATGVQLAPGIKLLVRARPIFKPQYGFTIEIDAIDPEYTLGDLEARKREIRERLKAEGVFTANKQLPPPWDFNRVLVIAPAGGAGLGDFQAEADRLEKFGVCNFTYTYSRFQGEGAAREICDALQTSMSVWDQSHENPPDAVVIIRGGGAVNDMAWLNDYDLARFICDLPIPVLTGIGHERDSTVLDEVSNTKFDTPSKVVAGIEQVIAKRTAEAKSNNELICNRTFHLVQVLKTRAATLDASIRSDAMRHLSEGRLTSSELVNGLRMDAVQAIRNAAEISRNSLYSIKTEALMCLSDAKREVPLAWGQIGQGVMHAVQTSQAISVGVLDGILNQAGRSAAQAASNSEAVFEFIGLASRQSVTDAENRSEALMREIAGQGPEKTLKRGFALVRAHGGRPITRSNQVAAGTEIEISFSDGHIKAISEMKQK